MGRVPRPTSADELAAREQARAAKLTALHAQLAQHVQDLRNGADWLAWLTVAARFHDYSFHNTLLIAAQRPDARLVAGYEAWKTHGRHVNKGERGIQILAPILRRAAQDERGTVAANPAAHDARACAGQPAADRSAPPARRVTGFRVAYVWDVRQTSGEPLPEPPRPQLLTGHAPPGLWDALAAQVTEAGFTLTRGPCGTANGRTDFLARTVTVRADVDDAQAVKTVAHELAHVLLHDPTQQPSSSPAEGTAWASGLCRGRAEVEAESVAYLVSSANGLDTASYTFPYVTTWASGVDGRDPAAVVTETGQRVLPTARLVLAATPPTTEPAGVEEQHRTAQLADRVQRGREQTAELREHAHRLLDAATRPVRAPVLPAREAPTRVRVHPATPLRRLLDVNRRAADYYTDRLHAPGREGARATAYLASRGVEPALAREYALGYAPRGWTGLVEHLRRRGVTDAELLETGLAATSRTGGLVDRFRDRIMFPVASDPGAPLGFLGRALDPHASNSGWTVPKYLNTPETALYRKGELLYGLDHARDGLTAGAVPVLVEGPLDVLAVNLTGHRFTGVAPCGTALTEGQVTLLDRATRSLADRGVIVAFDADPAGREAALRAFPLLGVAGAWPASATLAADVDPAELLQARRAEDLRATLDRARQTPLADLVIDETVARWQEQLRWPEGKVNAGRAAVRLITTLPPEQVGRQVARLAQRLDLTTSEVTGMLVDALAEPGPRVAVEPPAAGATARGATTPPELVRRAFPSPVALASAIATGQGSATASSSLCASGDELASVRPGLPGCSEPAGESPTQLSRTR